MKKLSYQHKNNPIFVLPYLSAVLLAIPFLYYPLGFVACISLIPYLFFIHYFIEKSSRITKAAFITHTWLMGLFFMLLTVSWYINADTQSWSHLGSILLRFIVFLLWFLMAVAFSLSFLLLGWVVVIYKSRVSNIVFYVVIFPAAIVVAEYFKSVIFSVISYGEGGRIGPFWHFGSLGYAAASTPLIYSSRLIGLFGLSLLVVIVNVGLYFALRRQYKEACLILLLPVMISYLGFRLYSAKSEKFEKVATVQLPPEKSDYYSELNKVIDRSKLLRTQPASLLVLPEYSYYFEYSPKRQQTILKELVFHNKSGAVVYTRAKYETNTLQKNEIVVADDSGKTINTQNKSFLIPTGEYLPFGIQAAFWVTGQNKATHSFTSNFAVSRSKTAERPVQYKGTSYGILACSGVIAPQFYQQMTKQGAEILINSASLNEFRNSTSYHQQARQFVRFSAVANNRPFVQAARGGFAYIIDKDGKFLYSSFGSDVQVGAANVTINNRKSLYSKTGEWIVYLCLLILGVPLLMVELTARYKKEYAYHDHLNSSNAEAKKAQKTKQ